MQKMCWQLCYDLKFNKKSWFRRKTIPQDFSHPEIMRNIAKDSGKLVYDRLAAGPQSRKTRLLRPLRTGGQADIYVAILLALASTGPKQTVNYDELRTALNNILSAKVPQKQEITSALKHLSALPREGSEEAALDWDEVRREVTIADPYLRFFMKWNSSSD